MTIRHFARRGDIKALFAADQSVSGVWTFADEVTFSTTTTFNADPILSFADPALVFIETDAAADNTTWDFRVQSEQFFGRVINDAQSAAANWLVVNRTANTIDEVELNATTLDFNGAVDISGAVTFGSGVANLNDDGTALTLSSGSSTLVAEVKASAIQSLSMSALSLADDATGTFTLPSSRQGGLLFLTASSVNNVMTGEYAILYVDDTTGITEIAVSAGLISSGAGSNPDVDGDINVWSGTTGVISVKNRRGASRRIQLVLMG